MKSWSVLAVIAATALSGCATITRGTTNDVQFLSEPAGAIVTTSLGLSCTAPCVLKVPRKDAFQATFTLDGFETQTIFVRTEVAGGGAAGVVGNAVFGGIVGVGVDVASGAANDHSPNPVSVVMRRPAGPAVASGGRRR
jgi:predicted small secreted protein